MRVLLTGMSGTGKSALVRELRRRGYAAYDADEGFSEPRPDCSVLIERLRTRTTNSYGRDGAQRAQVLADLADVEPLLRRSADLVLASTAPPSELADVLLAELSSTGRRPR